jgi:hypothetical protein
MDEADAFGCDLDHTAAERGEGGLGGVNTVSAQCASLFRKVFVDPLNESSDGTEGSAWVSRGLGCKIDGVLFPEEGSPEGGGESRLQAEVGQEVRGLY